MVPVSAVTDFIDDATETTEEFADDAISAIGPAAASEFLLPGTGASLTSAGQDIGRDRAPLPPTA